MNELQMGQVKYGATSKVLSEELKRSKHANMCKRNKIHTTVFRRVNVLLTLLAG
jgi:hypothetical protein